MEELMPTLRIIDGNSITSLVLLTALLASSPAQAHIVLQDPRARTTDTDLTIEPCGEKPKSVSVATYPAGTNIEITFDLTVQHRRPTNVYISYDDFATRTRLASMSTPDSDVYKMTVPLPAQPLGPAVIQINHENYYSCADITLEQGPEFAFNAGLNDAWYNPDTDGQGFFITVFPDLSFVSLAWFTYDTDLPSMDATARLGDPGHRWLTAAGPFTGNQAVMNIVITSDGIFDTATDVQRTNPPGSDGTLILTFDSCHTGTVEYDIPSLNMQGSVHIQRVVVDNIALCQALSSD